MNTVSVKQAIYNAKFTVIFPAAAIVLGGLFGGVFLVMQDPETPWPFLGGIVGGFVLGWLYWSFAITYWRIWAFENVRNVQDLKRQAVRAKVIWPDGSWLEKTEIRSHEQRETLRKLQRKFNQPDVFHDDLSVPKSTAISHSKGAIIFGLVIMPALAMGTGIYIYLDEGSIAMLLVGVPLSIFLMYQSIKRMRDKQSIVIDAAGILLPKLPFLKWEDIIRAEVIFEQQGKYQQHFLVVETRIHYGKINIGSLNANFEKLEHLLQVYRVRFEKQLPHHR